MVNEVVVQKKTQVGIAGYLNNEAVRNNIMGVVGEKNLPRFVSSVVSAVQTNPALAKCTNSSILSSALLGEALQLSPSPQLGHFYMVPYDDRKKGESNAQFQMGYKGYIQLAIRSGQYRKIIVSEIKEGELKSYNPIMEDFEISPIMDAKKREAAPVVGYFAGFELINGFRKEIFWTKEAMEIHAKKYSKGYNSDLKNHTAYTFWSKDFDGMAKKTMIRQLISKWGIMSVEMTRAFNSDMAVLDDNMNPMYVDNPQNDIQEVTAQEIAENANQIEFTEVVDAGANG